MTQHRTASREEMRELDRLAIEEIGIPSIVLMENAGRGVFDVIRADLGKELARGVTVLCGSGNNGGDGVVVARWAHLGAFDVRVFTTADDDRYRSDALVNLNVIRKLGLEPARIEMPANREQLREALESSGVIVDALFGTGLAGPVLEPLASVIRLVNAAKRPVVAVDIPSGLDANTGEIPGEAVRANVTATMGYAKKGFYLNRGPEYAGVIHVIDIGIPDSLYDAVKDTSFPSTTTTT